MANHLHEPYDSDIALRMPRSLRDRIEQVAAAERRRLSDMTRILLEDAVSERRKHDQAAG